MRKTEEFYRFSVIFFRFYLVLSKIVLPLQQKNLSFYNKTLLK